MKEEFESKFSGIQSDMISVCLEYIENKGDKIYIYCSYENKCTVCNFFFEINGILYKKHKLPSGYDVSINRQKECMKILNQDMESLIESCIKYNKDIPTEIKITYSIESKKLSASLKYENVYSDSGKSAVQVSEEWFNEIMITKKILDGVIFDYGWRVTSEYTLFNKTFKTIYIFDAYEESEVINESQRKALEILCKNELIYSEVVKELLLNYISENKIIIESEALCDEINLTSIFFTQEGDVFLLCEVPWDIEKGLAIKILPDYDIGPQDAFL